MFPIDFFVVYYYITEQRKWSGLHEYYSSSTGNTLILVSLKKETHNYSEPAVICHDQNSVFGEISGLFLNFFLSKVRCASLRVVSDILAAFPQVLTCCTAVPLKTACTAELSDRRTQIT